MPLFCCASQSRPASIPANGPAKSGTVSGTTVSPVSANRFGSPFALMMMPVHCADSVARTRSRIETPPISMRALPPPPMRRASPPARTRPSVGGKLVVMHGGLASMLGAFLFDEGQILIEHDAIFAGQRNETFAARAPNQRQICLAREFDAPSGETRSRNENRNTHAYCFDHHFRREPAGGVEDLVCSRHLLLEHPASDLVDRIVATDILHVDQRLVALRQHTAVNGARLEIE